MTDAHDPKHLEGLRKGVVEAADPVLEGLRKAVTATGDEIERLRQLDAASTEYVELLEKALNGMAGFAHTHGIRASDADIRRGEELRQHIAELRGVDLDLDAPPPQSKIFRRAISEGEFEE